MRSNSGRASFRNCEGLFHPFAKASGSFVVAISLEPGHQCPKFFARLVSTLALVGFLHRLAHVGVTRLGKVRAKISEFMELAPLDDREVPENVEERLADTFASVYHAENRLIDAQSSLEKVLQQSGAYGSVLCRAQPYSQRHLRSIYCDTKSYDDGLSGHLKTVHHQRRELELLQPSRQVLLELFTRLAHQVTAGCTVLPQSSVGGRRLTHVRGRV